MDWIGHGEDLEGPQDPSNALKVEMGKTKVEATTDKIIILSNRMIL